MQTTNLPVRSLVQKRMYLYPTLSNVFEIVRQNTLVYKFTLTISFENFVNTLRL